MLQIHDKFLAMRLGLFIFAIALFLSASFLQAEQTKTKTAYLIDIKGAIGPATSDYVRRGMEKARTEHAAVIVLRIDTPGGLDTAMREIIQDILSSPIPVVSYVTPSGARAASAGTYILYASHVAAMAPGTNLGAATPVRIGGGGFSPFPSPKDPGSESDKKDGSEQKQKKEDKKSSGKSRPTLDDKAINDAVAYIRGLAQLRERNIEWAEKAVLEAASLPAEDALKNKVIDVVADNLDDLFSQLEGREIKVLGSKRRLDMSGLALQAIEPDWRSNFLSVITNPNVAYILMLIGIYGLILEFYSPGLVGPGVIGAISLCLAFYAFNVLPVNYAGLALIIFGIALMIAEAFAPSFGILGLGGVASFILGSIMLVDTDIPGYTISWKLIASVGAISTGFFLFAMIMIARSRQRPVVSGVEDMIGKTGEVIDWTDDRGHVRIHGEIWNAKASTSLSPGSQVRIESIDGLTLTVDAVT